MNAERSKFKLLLPDVEEAIEDEIKMMLHCHRDCLRNRKIDTTKVPFDVRDGYYGEAFGIMRTLQILGYGSFGLSNMCNRLYPKWNLKWWMGELEKEVLTEEGFDGSNECDYCLEKYGKDAVRNNRMHITFAHPGWDSSANFGGDT